MVERIFVGGWYSVDDDKPFYEHCGVCSELETIHRGVFESFRVTMTLNELDAPQKFRRFLFLLFFAFYVRRCCNCGFFFVLIAVLQAT